MTGQTVSRIAFCDNSSKRLEARKGWLLSLLFSPMVWALGGKGAPNTRLGQVYGA